MGWTRTRQAVVAGVGSVALVGATLGALVLSGTPAGGAQTTIGNTVVNAHCDAGANGGSFSVVQENTLGASNSYAVPAGGGTLTSWSLTAWTNDETAQLEVWRPEGGSSYMLVFISAGEPVAANSGLNTFTLSPPVLVNGGDLLGVGISGDVDGGCLNFTGNGSDVFGQFFPTFTPGGVLPAQGSTYTANPDGSTEAQADIAATFDPPTAACAITTTGANQLQATATVAGGTATAFAWTDTGGTPGSGSGNPFTFTVPGPGTYTATVTATVGGTPVVSSPCSFTVPATPASALLVSPEFTG